MCCGYSLRQESLSSSKSSSVFRDWKVQVIHSYREANGCADFLTNEGIKGPLGFVRLVDPPPGIKDLLFYDTVGAASPRMCVS